jgi:hypothetical protein
MVVVAVSILLWFRHRGWIGGERNLRPRGSARRDHG